MQYIEREGKVFSLTTRRSIRAFLNNGGGAIWGHGRKVL